MTRRLPAAVARLLGVAAGLAVVVVVPFAAAPAALASGGLTVTIDSPGPGQTVTDSSAIHVSGSVGSIGVLSSVDSITVTLTENGIALAPVTLCNQCGSDNPLPFTYNKTVTANGSYSVHVAATGSLLFQSVTDGSADRSFTVAVPPPAPTGVTAKLQPDGTVKVSWNPITGLDDVRGYSVSRRPAGGDFKIVGAALPSAPTYVDHPPAGGGSYQYQVITYRNAAVASNDPNSWLPSSPSASASVDIPVPVTTTAAPASSGPTTTLPVGGGLIQGGAASSAPDLGSFFSSNAADISLPPLPPATTIPDGTYSETLPFGAASDALGKVNGVQPGRPSSSSGSGKLETDKALSNSNRRALLVPVAAGSVLSVAALQLRWLNRRLAIPPVGKREQEPEALEPDDPGDDDVDPERDGEREPGPFRAVRLRPAGTPSEEWQDWGEEERVPVGAGPRRVR
jgi:hypothetical protein